MKPESVQPRLQHVVVPLLFAICGACSAAYLLSSGGLRFPAHMPKMLPIPFALLCALLFLRKPWVVFAVPFIIGVWPIAYLAALYSVMVSGPLLVLPVCVGDLIGGLGLVLCVSTCDRRLLSSKYIFRGAKIGAVSALGFVPWLWWFYANLNSTAPPQWLLICAFAIWQGAVGKYLYEICTDTNRKESHSEGSDLETVARP
jgi:hypothetical protein